MPQSLPPIPEPDLGAPPALKALVFALAAAAFELTLELMLFGVDDANPWVSLVMLGVVYLIASPLLTAHHERQRRQWRARWGAYSQAAE